MTDGEYGRLQRWIDDLGLSVVRERGRWHVAIKGWKLAAHRDRPMALRMARREHERKKHITRS